MTTTRQTKREQAERVARYISSHPTYTGHQYGARVWECDTKVRIYVSESGSDVGDLRYDHGQLGLGRVTGNHQAGLMDLITSALQESP